MLLQDYCEEGEEPVHYDLLTHEITVNKVDEEPEKEPDK